MYLVFFFGKIQLLHNNVLAHNSYVVFVISCSQVGTLRSTLGRELPSKKPAGSNANGVASSSSSYQEGQARAKFNFQSQTPMELSLVKGINPNNVGIHANGVAHSCHCTGA